ncbi:MULTISPECIES: aldehyde dehydrogenase family protein [Pseudomonas]|uniref:Aldehyde dehydrogenase family protein n=1 Tax=Pseudomonas piscis TaxID=2614538 RepID=A0ABY9NP67_9PSED|nr:MULTISPECIES: aldehyde dehydrogenase family protein [Pseudomonas]WMN20330.1 aldehyde dehydrogenase family protein [Pseudomonas piscis]
MATIESDMSSRLAMEGYRTFNPATGELLREYPTLSDGQAHALVERAHEAFLAWRSEPLVRRIELFRKLADRIDANVERLARQITVEMGKPLEQARFEVGVVSSMLRYYADHAAQFLADSAVAVSGFSRVYTRREPVGVVVGIEPWNGPLYQAMRAAVPNLMLGNSVVLKPAEITAGSTLILEELLVAAGFPEAVFQVALVSREQISTYIADPRVRGVTLTGSDRAGAQIGAQAGRHIKPLILELGGSDPFIVLDSADIPKAASSAAISRLALGGQICISPKRVIVTEKVADAFIEAYGEIFMNQKIGDPLDPQTTLGPLSSPGAVDTLQAQYDDAIAKGAQVLVEGGRMPGPGAYFKPAVLGGITADMRLYYEEAFGPIGIIYRVADADAAVVLANDSPYGLGGTVYGKDLREANRVAQALDIGMVGINQYLGGPIEIPFGGTKASGIGRELGSTGMDAFANIKTYALA